MLSVALHSVRSLLSTATNETPHERFFKFDRKTGQGHSLPSWLLEPGPVFLRNFQRSSKSEPLIQEVELLHANPTYAFIRFNDGRESSVSLRDLAPCPRLKTNISNEDHSVNRPNELEIPTNLKCTKTSENDSEFVDFIEIPIAVPNNSIPEQ